MRKVRTTQEIQAEHDEAQAELDRMAADEKLDPGLRATIMFGAASIFASPKTKSLNMNDLRLKAR